MSRRGGRTSATEVVERVWFDHASLHVVLRSGRELSLPLSCSPRLARASEAERDDWRLIADGEGIHWPRVDEDLSVEGLLRLAQTTHPA